MGILIYISRQRSSLVVLSLSSPPQRLCAHSSQSAFLILDSLSSLFSLLTSLSTPVHNLSNLQPCRASMDVSWMRLLTPSTTVGPPNVQSPYLDTDGVFPIVNVLNPEVGKAWDSASEFDASKDKEKFRQYETACDRVKNFYKEQHGERNLSSSFRRAVDADSGFREADSCVQP